MELLTAQDRARLLANGRFRRQAEAKNDTLDVDFLPVVKLFTPDAECTWLLTELDPEDTDRAFGLCDLGLGFPELGYVRISQLVGLRGKRGLPVERDNHFVPAMTLTACAARARTRRMIVE